MLHLLTKGQPVHLAAAGTGKLLPVQQQLRQHVFRQRFAQLLLEFPFVGCASVRRHDTSAVIITACQRYALRRTERTLDFSQLDTVAAVLNLAVPPPEKHQFAPVIVRAQIARAVHQLRNLWAQRIEHEDSSGFLRCIVVARRQTRAAHADFPVDEHNACVGAGKADGQAVRVRKGSIHPVPRTHVGNFSGSVHIHVVSIGQGKTPPVQRGTGHDFAAEKHPP